MPVFHVSKNVIHMLIGFIMSVIKYQTKQGTEEKLILWFLGVQYTFLDLVQYTKSW